MNKTKMFGNLFDRFCWRLKSELQNNRKPILLFFGNGFESQILLLALHSIGKRFRIVHVAGVRLEAKTLNALRAFRKYQPLILRPYQNGVSFKTFTEEDAFCMEDLDFGFSSKDYLRVVGFKLSEDYLRQAYHKGFFKSLYCPLLRYADEDVQNLYQEMKDNNEELGDFLLKNNASDSHHNIEIT